MTPTFWLAAAIALAAVVLVLVWLAVTVHEHRRTDDIPGFYGDED